MSKLAELPFSHPVKPMLAKARAALPKGEGWLYEPKWDGFRCLIFRSGDELYLQSRDSKPLLRYFPELRDPLLAALPERAVVDGELVLRGSAGLDFDQLQQRIHPAKSRVDKLASQTPASVVLWDLIAMDDDDLRLRPFADRRAMLERYVAQESPVHLTPITADRDIATDWFERFEGAGLDGVIAKPAADPYQPGKRAMLKIKHERTLDCAVAGFRWHKSGGVIGSLILGLFDGEGRFHQLGVAASFTAKRRVELVAELEPLRENAMEGHPWQEWAENSENERRPGVVSRWSGGRSLRWEPLRMERVAEVKYNHLASGRFRHPVQFKRWRFDKAPRDCTYDQLEVIPPIELDRIFGAQG
jgi:ATP-dependent DNA ligase